MFYGWNGFKGSKKAIIRNTERLRDMELALELLLQEHESKLDHEHNVGEVESLELALALSQAENEACLKSVQDEKEETELELARLSQAENEARLKVAQDVPAEVVDETLELCQNYEENMPRHQSASSFRAALFFIFAALLTLMSHLPAVGGILTLSEVQTSPQERSRSEQMLSVSPGSFLTPHTGYADKDVRVKRQKGVYGYFTL